MLTVWCVYTRNKQGAEKYPIQYVYNLRSMVASHCSVPYRFRCITDRADIPLVDTVPALPGLIEWWQKLALFHYAKEPWLYFDLDTILTGDIATLLPYTKNRLSMSKNWSLSGHGGFQSSVMAGNGEFQTPFNDFKYEEMGRLWGDQEYLSKYYTPEICEIPAGLVCSYKYHCQRGLPDEAVAVTFHGKPDYHEIDWCEAPWIQQHLHKNSKRIQCG